MCLVADEAAVSRRLDERQRQREGDPAEQREQQNGLPASPALGHVAPERHRHQLDERPEPHQHPGLGRVHAELLEVDADQREQRSAAHTARTASTEAQRPHSETASLLHAIAFDAYAFFPVGD